MDEKDSFRIFDPQIAGAIIFYALAGLLVLERVGWL